MKALILNSGLGHRMGVITKEHPKCMTEISYRNTILSRQLRLLVSFGIEEVVMTTGYYDQILVDYCDALHLPLKFTFVNNPEYATTNYIYSIYCAKEQLKDDDIILMHGDLVFESQVMEAVIDSETSCMAVSSTLPLPEKDFKAVIKNGKIEKIGIEFFDDAMAAQPLYKIKKEDWLVWLANIERFCEADNRKCYAENAFNEMSDQCKIYPCDVKDMLCAEIDTPEDLEVISKKVAEINKRTVYMCFSTEYIHSGHVAILNKARRLGRLIIGILSDEAVSSFKRYPLIPFEERKALFENMAGVEKVVAQDTLSYADNLRQLKPDYVVHGNDWCEGFQQPIRQEVIDVLHEYGGKLVEYPYSNNPMYKELDAAHRAEASMPDVRRGRLRKLINMKGLVTAMEAHSGITGLIVEKTKVLQDGKTYQFDAMWVSSLCDSTAKGKPDIELVDMTSRFRTIDDIMEVTTKPIIFDGDTGGLTEHFVYTVRSLERMGVSMVIIEESLILEQGMEDALNRAFAFSEAGADAIMIHSRKKDPAEIFEFVGKFREKNTTTPIVVVPTSFNTVTEQEFKDRGVNVVIYANQLTRTGFPAMQDAARTILENHRAKECDDKCMSIKEIITLIPEE